MREMHLRQPAALGKLRFTYSACGDHLLKTKKECRNSKKQETTNK